MKKKTNITTYFVALAALIVLTFSGCTKEESVKSGACNWDKEYEVFLQRSNDFSTNPSKSTCSALKTAALNVLNKLGNCTGAEAAGIKAAADAWKDVDCNF